MEPSYLDLKVENALKRFSAMPSRPLSLRMVSRSSGLVMKPTSTRTEGIAVRQRTQNGSWDTPLEFLMGLEPMAEATSSAKARLLPRWAFCMRLNMMEDWGSLGSNP